MIRCRTSRVIWGLAFAVVFGLMLAVGAAAQGTPNGTISGFIVDPHGLAAPCARVVVVSADTGATRGVFSNQQGMYSVPSLLPGPYNLTLEASGFKTVHES
jgi:carboxypeptidase family protein